MEVVAVVVPRLLSVTGDQEAGWSVAEVTEASNQSFRIVEASFEIQGDGSGYVLCCRSSDGLLYSDTWHPSLQEAQQVALEEFGIPVSDWIQPTAMH
jgi:hypothetical protein